MLQISVSLHVISFWGVGRLPPREISIEQAKHAVLCKLIMTPPFPCTFSSHPPPPITYNYGLVFTELMDDV